MSSSTMETEAAPATSSSNGTGAESSKKEQMTEIAMNLLAQGRRHLLVSDIPSAIAALAESTQILAEHYGEQADECAESYYYYGMALLEMARTDSDVLGDAVEGGDKGEDDGSSDDDDEDENGEEDEEDKGEGEEEEKKVNGKAETNGTGEGSSQNGTEDSKTNGTGEGSSNKEAKDSKTNGEAKAAESSSAEKPEEVEMKEDDKKEDEEKPATDPKATESDKTEESLKPKKESKGKSLKAPGTSATTTAETPAEDGAEGEDTGDDVSNLQLAWEVFELAKNIFQRRAETDPSVKARLADSLVRLAEVAIESENYASAIEDLQKCLEIQLASFPADSRSLAETYYQLGVAYTFTTEFREAIKSFESAAEVIKLRIENLKNPAEKKPSMEEPRNMFHTIEGEIEELEALLPDIREKIADTVDLEKEALRKLTENGTSSSTTNGAGTSADEPAGASATAAAGDSPSKPATDITHLIRKKRKPEEVEAEASAPKKVCTDPVADPVAS